LSSCNPRASVTVLPGETKVVYHLMPHSSFEPWTYAFKYKAHFK
jgi:hypothetical protein